jgi:hypothetical protein
MGYSDISLDEEWAKFYNKDDNVVKLFDSKSKLDQSFPGLKNLSKAKKFKLNL